MRTPCLFALALVAGLSAMPAAAQSPPQPVQLNLGGGPNDRSGAPTRTLFQQLQGGVNNIVGARGNPNGLAGLDSNGRVPAAQLPFIDAITATDCGLNVVQKNQAACQTVAPTGALSSITLGTILGFVTNPYFYGYVDGATPDQTTAAIQAALNSGRNVDLMEKVWFTSSPLAMTKNNQYLIARSEQAAIISTVATGDIIDIGDGTNPIINAGIIGNPRIWTTIPKADSTYAVKAVKLARGRIAARIGALEDQVRDGNLLAYGLALDTASLTQVSGGVAGYRGTGRSLWSAADGCAEIELSGIVNGGFANGTSTPWGGIGDHIGGGCGGVNLRDGGPQNNGIGLVISSELAGIRNREVFLDKGYAPDSNTLRNTQIRANSIFHLNASGIYTGGAGGAPVGYQPPGDGQDGFGGANPLYGVGVELLAPQLGGALFDYSGATIYGNQRDGFLHWGGDLILNGAKITQNGRAPAGGSGYRAKPSATDGLIAVGADADRNGLTADLSNANASGASWRFEAGSDNWQVTGGSARFSRDGGVQAFGGFAATRVFSGVKGFVGRVTGRFAVVAGSSTVTIPTGLNTTPTKFMAFPDNTGVTGYQPIRSWSTNATNPANIDINLAGAASATQAYTYTAE